MCARQNNKKRTAMSSLFEPPGRIRSRTEAHVLARMDSLFARYPHLVGFFLQDPTGFKDAINPGPEADLCILDMGFTIELGEAAHEKVRELIRATVQQILSERPEAFELMRERTFARALH